MNAQFQLHLGGQDIPMGAGEVTGEFVERRGERFYVIRGADQMAPFFTCTVSAGDHWLFASSNGSLSCGRRNSERALFPYATEDKIRDNVDNTGPYTAFVVGQGARRALWEPFRRSGALAYKVERNLYKSAVGDKLGFEEINHDLGLAFYYDWCTSERFGFVRRCQLVNLGDEVAHVSLVDGVQNILPACVDQQMQLGFSCLLDAYKTNETVGARGLAAFTLASQIVDRAEPREALRASMAFGLGLEESRVLVSAEQISAFLKGATVRSETSVRGVRGAYFQATELRLDAGQGQDWFIVLDVERTQSDVASLARALEDRDALAQEVEVDIARGAQALRTVVAKTDGQQVTSDEATTVHHFANTLFNDMRGGVYANDYQIGRGDFEEFVRRSNRVAWETHLSFLRELPEALDHTDLRTRVVLLGEPVLERLMMEYLPLTFSRRHGDPSRPWNKFDIRVRDEKGRQLLGFQGNWRDIFQNWEALSLSYPGYIENIIAKFVNASTVDGNNPYRITGEGIDWEVPEPENPWAGIGYWGDHQIIYLLKLLEQSRAHHPQALRSLLTKDIFSYGNVPYRIKDYPSVRSDPQNTIDFDHERHETIEHRVALLGSDGKLLLTHAEGGVPEVVRVNLVEKLLVMSLAKMGNFVPGAGIWLNTQRPEWNDANNALVGSGVSMVTLYYLTRFFHCLGDLLAPLDEDEVEVSSEVVAWLRGTVNILEQSTIPSSTELDDTARCKMVDALGQLADDYRRQAYVHGLSDKITVPGALLSKYVGQCRRHLEHTVAQARREGGLYHAYNLLKFEADGRLSVEPLYEMLEGQVAALSAGVMTAKEAIELLKSLRKSGMYRADQNSYMLYPDRTLSGFLEKNTIPESVLASSTLLTRLSTSGDSVVVRDAQGTARFAPELYNAERLEGELLRLCEAGESMTNEELSGALVAYEEVFHHHAFTGRSGTMFGYEGLGSIYWHMVAKLLLAVQENYFWAEERGASVDERKALADCYYDIREGVGGFNKSPQVYGAFPMDPYSHTPERSGARQPGMTGQVKEEVLTRFGELGVRVKNGAIHFSPTLLRRSEFLQTSRVASFEGTGGPVALELSPGELAFTYCGLPIVYRLASEASIRIIEVGDAVRAETGASLSPEISAQIFERSGTVIRLEVDVPETLLRS